MEEMLSVERERERRLVQGKNLIEDRMKKRRTELSIDSKMTRRSRNGMTGSIERVEGMK